VLLWTRTKIKSHMAFLLAKPTPHNVNHDNDRFSMFNKKRDIPMLKGLWYIPSSLKPRQTPSGLLAFRAELFFRILFA
jgi:hypothetical protein